MSAMSSSYRDPGLETVRFIRSMACVTHEGYYQADQVQRQSSVRMTAAIWLEWIRYRRARLASIWTHVGYLDATHIPRWFIRKDQRM